MHSPLTQTGAAIGPAAALTAPALAAYLESRDDVEQVLDTFKSAAVLTPEAEERTVLNHSSSAEVHGGQGQLLGPNGWLRDDSAGARSPKAQFSPRFG